jgi:glucose-1-phosphate adenylyltransferase
VEHSILNGGCIIDRANIRRSIIGVRSRIGAGTVVENSLVMGADYYEDTEICGRRPPPVGIGKKCMIRKAIIDKNVRIGNRVVLDNSKRLRRYDDPAGRYYIRNGIVVVAKGAVIEDGMKI